MSLNLIIGNSYNEYIQPRIKIQQPKKNIERPKF